MSSSSPTSSSSGRRRRLPLHQQQQQRPFTTKRASPATSRETSPTGRTASPIGSRGGSSSPTGRRSPTTGRSTYASSLTSSASSSPTQHHSSFSSLSASRQRQYLDERKRQRVLQHLGGSDNNDGEQGEAVSSASYPYQAQQQQDPLLIAPTTTSTMSPRFFLTPPERLQVNQSVNLMDVETGQYEFRTSDTSSSRKSFGELPKRKSSAHSGGTSLLSSIFGGKTNTSTSTSPQNSFGFSSLFGKRQQPELDTTGGSSHEHSPRASFTKPQQDQDSSSSPTIETFHDEEVGLSKDASERSNTKKRSSKKTSSNGKKTASSTTKNKDPSSLNFPTNFNPNDWEQKVKDSKQQAQDEETVKASSGKKTKTNTKIKSKRKKLKRKLKNKLKKIKPGRLALVFFVLTMFGMALLLLIMATTGAAWSWFHPEEEKARSVNQDSNSGGPSIPPPHLIERNHSFLELGELPPSTQLLLTTGTSVFHETAQHEALLWIEEDPHVTIVGMNSNDTGSHSTMETLSARQRFALATLHFSSATPLELPSDPAGWMDYHRNECDWFGVHRNYTVCNRYHQLHALPLRHANFQGTLPVEELSLLSNLRRVDLGYNQIQGILPPTLFSQWKNLEYLGLEHNALTGPLPSAIGLLTNSNGLDTLQLSYNQFSGTIPSEIGVLIPHLRHLNVMHNRLSGTIPTELGGFGNGNAANGTFGGYGTDYAALEELSLSGNFFTGKIPSELGRLTQLTKLALHHNLDLEAHQILPKEICQLPLLEVITVDCDIVKCPTSVPCPCSCVGQHAATSSSVFTLNHDGTASKATTMAPVVQQQERKQHSNEIHGSSAAISLQQRSGGGGSTTTDSKEGEAFQGAVGVVKRSQQNVFDQEHNPYKDNPFAKQKKQAPKTFTLDTKKTHHHQQQQGDSQNVFDQNTRRGLLRASFTL